VAQSDCNVCDRIAAATGNTGERRSPSNQAVELGRRVRPCGPVERRRSLDQQREGRPATDSVLASVPPAAAGHATGVLSDNVTLRSIPLRLRCGDWRQGRHGPGSAVRDCGPPPHADPGRRAVPVRAQA